MPPAVQTELHELQVDLRAHVPTDFSMPIAVFTDECWAGLVRGDEIPTGEARERFLRGGEEKKRVFEDLVRVVGTP